jgi:hypothetical protein
MWLHCKITETGVCRLSCSWRGNSDAGVVVHAVTLIIIRKFESLYPAG